MSSTKPDQKLVTPDRTHSRFSCDMTYPLAILLRHAGKLLEDRIRTSLDRIGLHPSQGQMLRLLCVEDGVRQRDLIDRMRISAPTGSGILTRMEHAGLIKRRTDPADERVTRIHLSAKGRQMGKRAEKAIAEVEQTITAGLSREKLREAHVLLRALRDNLGGQPPGQEPPVEEILP